MRWVIVSQGSNQRNNTPILPSHTGYCRSIRKSMRIMQVRTPTLHPYYRLHRPGYIRDSFNVARKVHAQKLKLFYQDVVELVNQIEQTVR